MTIISPIAAVKTGWQATNRQLWLLMGMVLFMVVVSYVPSFFGNFDEETLAKGPAVMGTFGTIFFVIQIINLLLGLGFMKAALKAADGQPVRFDDLFSQAGVMLNYIAASILVGLATLSSIAIPILAGVLVVSLGQDNMDKMVTVAIIGIIAALAIGWTVFLSIRWSLLPYIIIDQSLGPIAALKLSWQKTAGHAAQLFGFFLLSILIGLLGILALGVGYLVAMPVITIGMASIYRQLITENI